MKRSDVGLREIAEILGCSKGTAWLRLKSGDIAGGKLILGRVWVAPRAAVAAYKKRRELKPGSDRDPRDNRSYRRDEVLGLVIRAERRGFSRGLKRGYEDGYSDASLGLGRNTPGARRRKADKSQ